MSGYKLNFNEIVISPPKKIWPSLLFSVGCHLALGGIWCLKKERPIYSDLDRYPVEILFAEDTSGPTALQKKQVILSAQDKQESILKGETERKETSTHSSLPTPAHSNKLVLRSGNPHPPYPPYAQENAIEGKVKVNVLIGLEGDVENIEISFPKAHPCLENSVLETVRQWKFEPPPEVSSTKYEFIFKLEA